MEERPEIVRTIRPGVVKPFVMNLLVLLGLTVVIVAAAWSFERFIGLSDFLSLFSLDMELSTIIKYVLLVMGGVLVFVLLENLISARGVRCELFHDRLMMHNRKFMVFDNVRTIPYHNVIGVSYGDSVFGTGKVTIELTGTNEKYLELEFIDEPLETVQTIQRLVDATKALEQARFTRKKQVKDLLEKF